MALPPHHTANPPHPHLTLPALDAGLDLGGISAQWKAKKLPCVRSPRSVLPRHAHPSFQQHVASIDFQEGKDPHLVPFRDVSGVLESLDPVKHVDCLLGMGFAYWTSDFKEGSTELTDYPPRTGPAMPADPALKQVPTVKEFIESILLIRAAAASDCDFRKTEEIIKAQKEVHVGDAGTIKGMHLFVSPSDLVLQDC
jgi:hypothetical protein